VSEQLNIHGGAESLRAADPPAARHETVPLFEFPGGLDGQLDLGGPIRDLDAWCESVVPHE
jgi:hypothetical protein